MSTCSILAERLIKDILEKVIFYYHRPRSSDPVGITHVQLIYNSSSKHELDYDHTQQFEIQLSNNTSQTEFQTAVYVEQYKEI